MAERVRQTVSVTSPQGFHFRPMKAFVEAANQYPCEVTVTRAGMEPVNGKSMLGLLGLIAVQGTELEIEVSGPQAAEALQMLLTVFYHNYDEDQEPGA